MEQTSHNEIIEEIRGLRNEVKPLLHIVPQLTSMADIYTAGKVGGGFLKWTAGLGGILLGAWAFIKAVAATIGGHS